MNGSKPIEYEEQKNEKSNAQGMLGDRSGYINEHYYEYVTLKYSEIYNVTYAYIGDMRLQFNKNGTINIKQLREIINNFSKIRNIEYP